jgi:outer membrane protein OmpA-like peptidoglycan-associated protein
MSLNFTTTPIIYFGLLIALLSSCTHPPYNHFKPRPLVAQGAAVGATMGAAIGAATTGTLPGALAGGAIGGTTGAILSSGISPKRGLIKTLNKEDIQFVQYGDTMTLIIPTDKYFMFESPRLNEIRYAGLLNVISLLRLYPYSKIYVAAFTDNVGTPEHKKRLSQAQAETMLSYLWANNIQAERLKAEGYGDKNTVGDNEIIHGSAFNRRIEIQWFAGAQVPPCCYLKQQVVMK